MDNKDNKDGVYEYNFSFTQHSGSYEMAFCHARKPI